DALSQTRLARRGRDHARGHVKLPVLVHERPLLERLPSASRRKICRAALTLTTVPRGSRPKCERHGADVPVSLLQAGIEQTGGASTCRFRLGASCVPAPSRPPVGAFSPSGGRPGALV